MTVQSPPYAEQNASHSAALFRQALAAGWASGGVVLPFTPSANELFPQQQATPNMSIMVFPGRGVIPGTAVAPPSGYHFTSQGYYFALNDAIVSPTIATSNPTNPRIDAVYMGVTDSFYSGSTNTAVIGVVTGTPAGSPSPPAIPVNSILIAYVAVAANATSIVNANISDQRVQALSAPDSSSAMINLGNLFVAAPGGTLAAAITQLPSCSIAGMVTDGGAVKVSAILAMSNGNSGANRTAVIALYCDGAQIGTASPSYYMPLASGVDTWASYTIEVVHTPSAGSHTYSLWGVASASATVIANNVNIDVTQLA